jgi:para-nitrobenzyl esterase
MNTRHARRESSTAVCIFTVCAVVVTAFAVMSGASASNGGVSASAADGSGAQIVATESGRVRGVALPGGGFAFRGLRYAAAPIGELRWRAPQPSARWLGIRDATQFAPSCPQSLAGNPFFPPGPISEDCLYLNIYTPVLHAPGRGRPVLVWIHGGGLTQDAARNYSGSDLAAEGTVVVTINYRLGALGFLAHPALASRPGGPAGNYGLMDQQAALRWVQNNIKEFGGDPSNVTIAGQSAGGLSVLAHLVSRGSRGLFQRAIVQSGAFALTQQPLADAEEFGQIFATSAGCSNQSAECLRSLPVSALVDHFPPAAIPGIVDGKVLTESIGLALAGGRFARVPILNGINHDEEFLFVAALGLAVSNGMFVGVPALTAESYQGVIATVLGVPATRAAAIAAEYPLSAYPLPLVAFTTLVSDANFACPALRVDRWASNRVPTFAYQFNDDTAPHELAPPGALPFATHSSELLYLFGLPNAPFPPTLNAGQEALAATMRGAWANFAANGDPSSPELAWPSFNDGRRVLSLVQPQPQVDVENDARHHCAFWAAG